MDQRVFIFLLVTWAKVGASNTVATSSWTVVLRVFENCVNKNDSLNCLQQKVLNFADRITQSKSLEVFEGFKFVRDEETGRSKTDSESTDLGASLSDQIWNKIGKFFKTHSVEVNIPRFLDTDNEARKKKGHHGILLLAGAAKGAMIYMGMQAIAALAGKALIVAKVALTIASVIALKKLLEGSSGKTSYEIIKHPQHTYVQTHSSSHEYGGGGHGGGYEGHYRKRSIAKAKINVNRKPEATAELSGASDYWRFGLPKKDRGIRLSTSLNDVNQLGQTNNGVSNEGGEFFLQKQMANQNHDEISEHDLFALNIEDKNESSELTGEASNNDSGFSPLLLGRSRLT